MITDGDETAYMEEVSDLAVWRRDNNLSLNVSKTKELIVNYRKQRGEGASKPPSTSTGLQWRRSRA